MIYQVTESLRLFIVFVPQLFIVIMFSFLIYKILKRNTNRSSLMLSGFYFFVSVGLALNSIAVVIASFQPGMLIAILYFIATFLIVFSFIFIEIFVLSLLKLKDVFTLKKAFIIILIYGIVWLIILLFPEGLTFTVNWVPVYSWPLYIFANIYFSISITIPTLFYSTKLYISFEAENLKKKIRPFLVGVITLITIIYGVLLFNTWQDPLFKTVWGIIVVLLLISSGLLIYFGIGRDL